MNEDWEAIAADVGAGLASVGATGYIVRKGAAGGDDFNPTPGTDTEHACTVVYSKWSGSQIDGTLIRATDQKLLVSTVGLDIVPEMGDRFWDGVSMNGADKVIGTFVPPMPLISPAGVVVMYTFNVRY